MTQLPLLPASIPPQVLANVLRARRSDTPALVRMRIAIRERRGVR